MVRYYTCLYFLLLWISSNAFAQGSTSESSSIRYSFVVDQKILHKELVVEQPLIIPNYQITLKSIPILTTCIAMDCQRPQGKAKKHINTNQTWGGIFNAKQRFRTDLSPDELAYKLSENIKGLDPILASKIVHLNVLKKVRLKKRPKTWSGFVKLFAKIQNTLSKLDSNYNYNLYNQVINVYGYENGQRLDYYSEQLCTKKIYECPAEYLDIRKKLISQVEKKITIHYQQISPNNSAKLFEQEKDAFEFIIDSESNKPQVLANSKYNNYQINWDPNSTNTDIVFNISPVSRKKVPLSENFIHLTADNFKNGIFFEWRLAQSQLNTLFLLEKENISIEYELCEIKFGMCAKKLRTKRFNFSTLNLPEKPSKNEILLQRLTLGKEDLKEYGLYEMTYKVIVKNSVYIAEPKNKNESIKIQFLPYY